MTPGFVRASQAWDAKLAAHRDDHGNLIGTMEEKYEYLMAEHDHVTRRNVQLKLYHGAETRIQTAVWRWRLHAAENRADGILTAVFKRHMEHKVLLRIIPAWRQVVAGAKRWREIVEGCDSKRGNRKISAAFHCWQGLKARRQKLRTTMNRFLSRWTRQKLWAGFHSWQLFMEYTRRVREFQKHMFIQPLMRRCLQSWNSTVRIGGHRKSAVRRLVLRMLKSLTWGGWITWMKHTHKANEIGWDGKIKAASAESAANAASQQSDALREERDKVGRATAAEGGAARVRSRLCGAVWGVGRIWRGLLWT